MEVIPVEVRLRVLAGQVYAAADLGMWCFNMKRELMYSTCPYENEFLNFLKLGECMDYLYSRSEGWERPVILNDPIGLIWIGETTYREGQPDLMILMGPLFLNRTSVKHIEETLRSMESSVFIRRQMSRILDHVPVIMMPMMTQYALMLHYTIYEEKILSGDCYYQNGETVDTSFGIMAEKPNIEISRAASDRERNVEQLLMQGIREGNPEFIVGLNKQVELAYTLVSDTGDILRDSKNTVLVFNALCSRAAVEGGLSPTTAKEVESRYAREAEVCDSVTKLTRLNNQLVHEYTMRVRECRENPHISQEIQSACDYIKANALKELSVDEISKSAGYTPYYFTKKFYKETGVRVTDYIKEMRIEYAKIALVSTKKGIQEISDSLHFGTRNYFSKVFHEVVGMSPTEYRERLEGGTGQEVASADKGRNAGKKKEEKDETGADTDRTYEGARRDRY